MTINHLIRTSFATVGLATFALLAGCKDGSDNDNAARAAVVVECVESASTDPVCPEALTFECNAEQDLALPVHPPEGSACADVTFKATPEAPYPVGTHEVTVNAFDASNVDLGEVCSSLVTVQDTVAPQATGQDLQLWPPNHKMQTITVDECVTVIDACDPDVKVAFTRVTSNEAEDGKGDGHHAPDIEVIDCSQVNIRRERSGNAGGRIYTFEWIARDAAGNETTGTCTANIAHDKGKGGKKVPNTTPMISVDIDPSDCVDDPPGDTTDTTETTSTDTSTETTETTETTTSTDTTETTTTTGTQTPPV